MASKKVGVLVKEARTKAGLTQEKLAKAAGEGLTGADIGKCERGTADLTNNQLKKIAVACGVTQSSLLNAPKNLSASAAKKAAAAKTATAAKTSTSAKKTTTAKTSASKTTAAKTTAAKTTAAKTTAAKKTTSSGASKKTAAKTAATPANANTSMKVTSTEKKLIETYRTAGSDEKKIALKVLKGEYGDKITSLLNVVGGGTASSSVSDGISDTIGSLLTNLLGGK